MPLPIILLNKFVSYLYIYICSIFLKPFRNFQVYSSNEQLKTFKHILHGSFWKILKISFIVYCL